MLSGVNPITQTDAAGLARNRCDARQSATFAAATSLTPPRRGNPVDPISRNDVEDEVISWQDACSWIYPGDPVSYDRMWRLVRNGARVRGSLAPIVLAAWPTPGGIKFRASDVRDFIDRFQTAWRAAHQAQPGTPAPIGGLIVGRRRKSRSKQAESRSLLRRCADHEIGTYPTDDKPPARRGGDLRLVGGSAGVKEDLGRHVDVTA